MSREIFIFCTSDQIGYITSQFIQGACLSGARVTTNSERLTSDGRHFPASLAHLDIHFRPQPVAGELIIVDENRILSSLSDCGESFFKSLLERDRSEGLGVLYNQDDANFIAFPHEISFFVPHQVKGFSKSPWVHPVPWGFTNELFLESQRWFNQSKRVSQIIINFNPTFNQSVRESVIVGIQSIDLGTIKLDQRHLYGEDYSKQLSESQFILAVGGTFHWPKTDYSWLAERLDSKSFAKETFLDRKREVGVLRWDSFRYWEGALFGCIPIQLDYNIYGFSLPNTPIAWEHYIPLNLGNLNSTFERLSYLQKDPEALRLLSLSARQWAINNCHPKRLYEYIIATIAKKPV